MTNLKFLAMVSGLLHLEAVRVVDLMTQETVEILDLPDIVSLPFNKVT